MQEPEQPAPTGGRPPASPGGAAPRDTGGPSRRKRTLADAIARRREVAIAGHRGDAATARAMLSDDDPEVRSTALNALLRAGDLKVEDLTTAACDPSPVVRRRAAELAASPALPPPRPLRAERGPNSGRLVGDAVPLLRLLGDPDARVVEMAAWACGERYAADRLMGSEAGLGAVGLLCQLVAGGEDPLVREAAVAALGSIGEALGKAAVVAACADTAAVRRRAVVALAAFEGPEVDAALDAALVDRDWQVRQLAGEILEAGEIPDAGD